ncbi:MAG: pyridoxamine 5'-phosphate oxidase family protein [Bryobacteraceae bacterium]
MAANSTPSAPAPSGRSTLRRHPERGSYDREVIYGILDAGFLCHVGFVEDGRPFVIPTAYGRSGDRLLIHGSAASRMMKRLAEGAEACVTVTLVDGLVLARSAFSHSVNFRSVVVFGEARPVTDAAEKHEALRVITENIAPGRWTASRQPTEKELKATTVVWLRLDEASAKVRSGPPKDDPEDLALGYWAGEVPLRWTYGPPLVAPGVPENAEPPPFAAAGPVYFRKGAGQAGK